MIVVISKFLPRSSRRHSKKKFERTTSFEESGIQESLFPKLFSLFDGNPESLFPNMLKNFVIDFFMISTMAKKRRVDEEEQIQQRDLCHLPLPQLHCGSMTFDMQTY